MQRISFLIDITRTRPHYCFPSNSDWRQIQTIYVHTTVNSMVVELYGHSSSYGYSLVMLEQYAKDELAFYLLKDLGRVSKVVLITHAYMLFMIIIIWSRLNRRRLVGNRKEISHQRCINASSSSRCIIIIKLCSRYFYYYFLNWQPPIGHWEMRKLNPSWPDEMERWWIYLVAIGAG